MKKPYQIADKIQLLDKAWGTHAPEVKFAGMTQAEFNTSVAPYLAVVESIASKRIEIRGDIAARTTASKASRETMNRVIHSILADIDHGPDSALYRALEYVTSSERANPRPAATPAVPSNPAPAPTA